MSLHSPLPEFFPLGLTSKATTLLSPLAERGREAKLHINADMVTIKQSIISQSQVPQGSCFPWIWAGRILGMRDKLCDEIRHLTWDLSPGNSHPALSNLTRAIFSL